METVWWKKLFSSMKRKMQRRRGNVLCLWKDMTHVLGVRNNVCAHLTIENITISSPNHKLKPQP
jgi:hypothetical protein